MRVRGGVRTTPHQPRPASLRGAQWRGSEVGAWGARGKVPPWLRCRFAEVTAIVRTVTTTHALSVTKYGDPAHPLYLPSVCRAEVWGG